MTMRRLFQPGEAVPPAPDSLLQLVRNQALDGHRRGGPLQETIGIYPEAILALLARLDQAESSAEGKAH